MPVNLEEINPQLTDILLYKEDRFFYFHPGFNPFAILRAAAQNVFKGKRVSGASTITMQTARLLNPGPRTYLRKLMETFRAIQLEIHYSKKEILQLYLSLVPYGGNIEGVNSASYLYLGKAPHALSLAECVALVIIPNRPETFSLGRNSPQILQERNRWLQKLHKSRKISDATLRTALDEPFNPRRVAAPAHAPHLSRRMARIAAPGRINTTINAETQMKVQNLVSRYVARIHNRGVKNAAVLVADSKSGEVLAYIGSADFNDIEDGGQVDGIRALRSPGSALKPLLWAMGFDKGLITPKSVFYDVPQDFSGYRPENYDRLYRGKINAADALAQSLNLPAVQLMHRFNPELFIRELGNNGFRWIAKNRRKLGMSLILGGCGVSPEEMTTAYLTFPNGGKMIKLRYLTDDSLQAENGHWFSEAGNYLTVDILSRRARPDMPSQYLHNPRTPRIGWKTGTSYGRRDAWSIGFNKRYTITVWLGNFSGEGVPALSGAEIATPLLFELFNTLDYNGGGIGLPPPADLDAREVCHESGMIPGEYCTRTIRDFYIPGISSGERCRHLSKTWVNRDSSVSYCMTCRPDTGYFQFLYTNLPPEALAWYRDNRMPCISPPEHFVGCTRIFAGNAPRIISPADGAEFLLEKGESQPLLLQCQVAADVKIVHWYVNDRYLRSAAPTERVMIKPEQGKLKIACTDDKGRSSKAVSMVRYY